MCKFIDFYRNKLYNRYTIKYSSIIGGFLNEQKALYLWDGIVFYQCHR